MVHKSIVLMFCIVLTAPSATAFSFLPDLLKNERYDEDAYEKMLPDQDIQLSRRRMDPETDEQFWNGNEKFNDDDNINRDTFVSNLDGDVKSIVSFNDIDISKLPANYHKTTTITRKVGGKNVTTTVKIDKTTDPKTGAVSSSVIQSSNDGGIATKQCTDSKKCGKDMYCRDLLYGNFCSKCSNVSDTCSSNDQCCGTSMTLCVKGSCQKGFKKGEAGTLCQLKGDCNTGLCCARKFMKKYGECKLLAKKGEKCSASHSQINTILHGGMCPCTGRLVCSSGSWLEGYFGGSMNGILGGNTCKIEKKTHNGWMSGFFDDGDEEFEDIFDH